MKKKPNLDKYIKFAIKIKAVRLYCEFDIFDGFKNKAIKTMLYVIYNPELFVKLTPFHQEESLKYIRDKVTHIFTNRRNNPEMGYSLCPKCKGYRVVISYKQYRYNTHGTQYAYVEEDADRRKLSTRKLFTGHNIDNCDFCDLSGQVDFIQYITKTKRDNKGRIINIQLKGVNEIIDDEPPF